MADNADNERYTQLLRHPLVRRVSDLTGLATGSRLLIVYQKESGWGRAYGDSHTDLEPDFCKLIKGTEEGAKHCRMCHILMAVAACSGGPVQQACHAGASVLVCPLDDSTRESIAVLSSCLFTTNEAWETVSAKGKKLGIPDEPLRAAFLALPEMTDRKRGILQTSMEAMSQAVRVLRQNQKFLTRMGNPPGDADLQSELASYFKDTAWTGGNTSPSGSPGRKMPLMVRVVCELARQRPDLPLTVKELAAAARLTPNHFTTMFHQHAGCSFTDYLTGQRIERAKKLLQDPTLNINEIARLVGYEDPGYFARRFRQRTDFSPREWRNRASREDVG